MEQLLTRLGEIGLTRLSGPAIVGLRVLAIAVAAWIVVGVTNRAIRLFRARVTSRFVEPEQARRAETIARVLRYLAGVIVTLIAGVLILSELGVSVAPILGAAGVVGLAVGFGAQSLVKDYFTGFFILLENQLTTGDVVRIADKSGLVEDVTLRFVRLRDYEGNVHFIPNSLITTVTNMSRGFGNAVMDIGIAYREDVDEAFGKKILADLEIAGVERLDDSAVVLRCRIKSLPLAQWDVRREFLRRLKKAFDARGIEIPYPHLTVYAGEGKDGEAPPFRVVTGPARR